MFALLRLFLQRKRKLAHVVFKSRSKDKDEKRITAWNTVILVFEKLIYDSLCGTQHIVGYRSTKR